MDTPILDFLRQYQGTCRFHMPGHKGRSFLGCEALDLTEVAGADSLYEAEGIIAQSEANASRLFGTGRTFYSAGGSSQCIRAMLYLALACRSPGTPPLILAARNVHKSFVYAAALLDFQVAWLWPEKEVTSLCACPVSPAGLEKALRALPRPPAAVYVTSPDYLGNTAHLEGLGAVCRRYGTLLLADNAHGAYLRFLRPSRHPMDLGADLCCDSAHKTLPVLTGGAYLHLRRGLPAEFAERARDALALFGSTSPSYLILASLDSCNACLAGDYPARLEETVRLLEGIRARLTEKGWEVYPSDPLRLTLGAPQGLTGTDLAGRLREKGMECEYADPEVLVLMFTPENTPGELARLEEALGSAPAPRREAPAPLPQARGVSRCSIRHALLEAPRERIPAEKALGRICGAPTVSCPPAIPIAVSGEELGPQALALFAHYGVREAEVLQEPL